MNRKIEWLITIVDRGRGDKVAEVYQRHHVAVQLVTHGRGTATSKIMDVLGLDEPEKDIVLSLVPGALSRDIFRALEEELHFARGRHRVFDFAFGHQHCGAQPRHTRQAGALPATGGKQHDIRTA